MKAKTKWTKETPTEDGWYWIKYKVGRFKLERPCMVIHIGKETIVRSCGNDLFFEGPKHGGKGLKDSNGKIDNSIQFGKAILIP